MAPNIVTCAHEPYEGCRECCGPSWGPPIEHGFGFLRDLIPLAIEAFGHAGLRRADSIACTPSWHRVGVRYLAIEWGPSTFETHGGALVCEVNETPHGWEIRWNERIPGATLGAIWDGVA